MFWVSLSPDIWGEHLDPCPEDHLFANAVILSKRNVFTPSHPVSNLRTVDCLVGSAGHHALPSHHPVPICLFSPAPCQSLSFSSGVTAEASKLGCIQTRVGESGWDSRDTHGSLEGFCHHCSEGDTWEQKLSSLATTWSAHVVLPSVVGLDLYSAWPELVLSTPLGWAVDPWQALEDC